MPTAKHRISISPDDELFKALERLSARRKRALSKVTLDLIRRALELEEDAYFSGVADARLKAGERKLGHAAAWR